MILAQVTSYHASCYASHRLASVGSDVRFYPDDDQIAKVAALLRLAIRNDKEATCQGDRGLRDDVALVDHMRKIAPTTDLQEGIWPQSDAALLELIRPALKRRLHRGGGHSYVRSSARRLARRLVLAPGRAAAHPCRT